MTSMLRLALAQFDFPVGDLVGNRGSLKQMVDYTLLLRDRQ
jgi:hypothetical protein